MTIIEPAPTTRSRLYPWAQHARYLRDHPNQWVMVEAALTNGTVGHVRKGRQADMAKLMPHLELRTRNVRRNPQEKSTRMELWARYRPGQEVEVVTQNRPGDEIVREIRERFAAGLQSLSELSEEFGFNVSTISSWVHGRTRRDAGGPINTERRSYTRH